METKIAYKAIIEATRKEYHLSRKEIADKIGCSTGYLNIIACGKMPSANFINRWIEKFPLVKGMFNIPDGLDASSIRPNEGKKRGRKPKYQREEANSVQLESVTIPTEESKANSSMVEIAGETKPASQWLEEVKTEENPINDENNSSITKVGESNGVEYFNTQMKKRDERIEWLELLNQEKDKQLSDIQNKYHESMTINSQLVMKYAEKIGI
jgi:transcriptional regulator with XRE-family HTH domain